MIDSHYYLTRGLQRRRRAGKFIGDNYVADSHEFDFQFFAF